MFCEKTVPCAEEQAKLEHSHKENAASVKKVRFCGEPNLSDLVATQSLGDLKRGLSSFSEPKKRSCCVSQLNGSHGEVTEGDDMISAVSSEGAKINAQHKRDKKSAESHRHSSNSGVKGKKPLRPCGDFFSATGCKRDQCRFPHARSDVPCQFHLFGRCNRGDQCAFAHPQLCRPVEVPVPEAENPVIGLPHEEEPEIDHEGDDPQDPLEAAVAAPLEKVYCPTFDRGYTLMDTELTSLVIDWSKIVFMFYLLEYFVKEYDPIRVHQVTSVDIQFNYRWVGEVHALVLRSDIWFQVPIFIMVYYRYLFLYLMMNFKQALFVWSIFRLPVCRRFMLSVRKELSLRFIRDSLREFVAYSRSNKLLMSGFIVVAFYTHQSFALSIFVLCCSLWFSLERDTSTTNLEFDTPTYVKENSDCQARSVKLGARYVQELNICRELAEKLLSANVSADGRNRGVITRLLFDAERLKLELDLSDVVTHEVLTQTVHYVAMRLTLTRSYLFESLDGTTSVPIKKFA